eukprot:gene1321-biopygen16782
MPAPRPRHPSQTLPVARATPAPCPRQCPVTPGGTGRWRGRGAGMRGRGTGYGLSFFWLGVARRGAGMARAWRGHVLCSQRRRAHSKIPLASAKPAGGSRCRPAAAESYCDGRRTCLLLATETPGRWFPGQDPTPSPSLLLRLLLRTGRAGVQLRRLPLAGSSAPARPLGSTCIWHTCVSNDVMSCRPLRHPPFPPHAVAGEVCALQRGHSSDFLRVLQRPFPLQAARRHAEGSKAAIVSAVVHLAVRGAVLTTLFASVLVQ